MTGSFENGIKTSRLSGSVGIVGPEKGGLCIVCTTLYLKIISEYGIVLSNNLTKL